MKAKILSLLRAHKRAILGFGIYYLLFTIVMLYGLRQTWNLRLLNIILLLILLFVSMGGDENYAVTFKAYRRDPFVAQDLKNHCAKWKNLIFLLSYCWFYPRQSFC